MTTVSVADLISEYLTGVEGYKATLDAYMEMFKVGGDEGTDRGHAHANRKHYCHSAGAKDRLMLAATLTHTDIF